MSKNTASKSQDRPKSEMFKKVEMLEKELGDFKKSQSEMKEQAD